MDWSQPTIVLFAIGQIVTIALAVGGWVVAVRITQAQLRRQHKALLRLDAERIRRELVLKSVMELIQRLFVIEEAATRVSGTMAGMRVIIHNSREIDNRIVIAQHIIPEFNAAWRNLLDVGLGFLPLFDGYEPIVHPLLGERDALFVALTEALACHVDSANKFIDKLVQWMDEPESNQLFEDAKLTLDACQEAFNPIHQAIQAGVTNMRVRLQNECLAPIFGHIVDPHRRFVATESSPTVEAP